MHTQVWREKESSLPVISSSRLMCVLFASVSPPDRYRDKVTLSSKAHAVASEIRDTGRTATSYLWLHTNALRSLTWIFIKQDETLYYTLLLVCMCVVQLSACSSPLTSVLLTIVIIKLFNLTACRSTTREQQRDCLFAPGAAFRECGKLSWM